MFTTATSLEGEAGTGTIAAGLTIGGRVTLASTRVQISVSRAARVR